MKLDGASAATRARLAAFVREGVQRINRLMTHGAGEEDDGGLSLEKRIAFELKLLEEGKELIVLEGDEGVSDIEEVRAENGRLRRWKARAEQLLARVGVDVELELGRLDLLEAKEAPAVAVAAASPPAEIAPPPPSPKRTPTPKGKAAKAGRPDVYEPRINGIK